MEAWPDLAKSCLDVKRTASCLSKNKSLTDLDGFHGKSIHIFWLDRSWITFSIKTTILMTGSCHIHVTWFAQRPDRRMTSVHALWCLMMFWWKQWAQSHNATSSNKKTYLKLHHTYRQQATSRLPLTPGLRSLVGDGVHLILTTTISPKWHHTIPIL